jgi:peptidoglycan/LPS O-acetylase OafA/YrhL
VMGGAVIRRDTTLLPLSLVLKEMNMVTGAYEGSPAEPVSRVDAEVQDTFHSTSTSPRNPRAPHPVDNTDWLKTAAVILVLVDHFGYFFAEDDLWWSVFGRLAAPTFFFLMGYAQSRTVPLRWIWLGVILTLLESWNANWTWVALNILLSLALVRSARPYGLILLQRHGWAAFAFLVSALLAVSSIAGNIVDYGSEGWLWALFGLCQRMYIDSRSATDVAAPAQTSALPAPAMKENAGRMRLLACLAAVVVYVWQEQREYSYPHIPFAVFIVGIAVWSASLCLFLRGPSRIQPPEAIAGAMRFIGRHTLEIYAIQLVVSELLVKLLPDLAP